MKIGHIITGWGKSLGFIQVTNAEKKLSELRLSICHGCPMEKESTFLNLMSELPGVETHMICNACGCPTKEKSLVVDKVCELGKW